MSQQTRDFISKLNSQAQSAKDRFYSNMGRAEGQASDSRSQYIQEMNLLVGAVIDQINQKDARIAQLEKELKENGVKEEKKKVVTKN